MHPHIQKLSEIASKQSRTIIGLMSGTSLDGLDIALCSCTGNGLDTQITLQQFETIPYPDTFKKAVGEVFSKTQVSLEKVCLLNGWVAHQHADLILKTLQQWNIPIQAVDLIASHGQTIYHAPQRLHGHKNMGNGTLQIGDGDHIAVHTGIITISDFRQKHIAAGGEGAPLAVYGDYLIFGSAQENRIMLNIGGIANFTYLPAGFDAGAVFSTDTGTGNTMMDAYIQAHYPGKYFDENATIAGKGKVIPALLQALLRHDFFEGTFPKTIGPELFNLEYLHQAMNSCACSPLAPEDVMATLNAFSATAIADAIKRTLSPNSNFVIYTSGGGMHNPLLMRNLQALLPNAIFKDTATLGINPDAKEAVLFAVLANECVSGGVHQPGNLRQGIPSVTMGKISFPD